MIRWIGVTFLLLLLSSCAAKKVTHPTGLTAQEFWRDQATRSEQLARVSAKVSLHFQGPKRSLSGRGALVRIEDKLSRLELRDPLGRTQYILAQSGKQVIAYYPSQKLAYSDDTTGKRYLGRVLALDLSLPQAEQIWLGILPKDLIAQPQFTDWRWDDNAGAYRALLTVAGHEMVCEVDGEYGSLRSLEWKTVQGDVEVRYQDFEPCCSESLNSQRVALAHSVSVQVKARGVSFDLDLSHVRSLKKEPPSAVFEPSLPFDTQKILLK